MLMVLKKFNLYLIAALIFVVFTVSSGGCEENYTSSRTEELIRVGISSNDFQKLDHKEISLTSGGKLEVFDKFLNLKIHETSAGEILKFEIEKTVFKISKNNEKVSENIVGPIVVKSSENQPIQVVNLKRKGKQAAYRGVFEIAKFPRKETQLSLVNVLPLEDYLKGVVPNELPTHFGMEALKAQAIAARNYAIRPRVKRFSHFDVCDSVQSQVYFGFNTEEPKSNEAIEMTKGLVALYEGDVILALYSSTAGGYTESYENAFSEPGGEIFPAKPLPYLKGKPDTEGIPVLNNEKNAREFYTTSPATFDVKSRYYRWTREWTGEELRKVLNDNLRSYRFSDLISPKVGNATDIGKIKRVDVPKRGVAGKAFEISIKTDRGEWTIKKELLIRRILKKDGSALPSANLVFENYADKDGYLVRLKAFGGGFGHGVGMSQFGASYMSQNGYSYDQILQRYYNDVAIGTWPVYLTSEYNTLPVKQRFYSPKDKAELFIENFEGIESFNFMINSKKVSLGKKELEAKKVRISLDKYIKKGINEIVYYSIDDNFEGKSVKAWVEVFNRAD
ncbi:MAG TPA: SpoIID/LytB domain-containing protein [Candidatus Gastranaerophilales bacterium]|nr:SpoIID/LytB domain-containing protein [Candidatus Gastranaerophilales bacterium]